MTPESLSVVIPTWNSSSYLEQTLRTVVTQLANINKLQVIVVDDGSSDDTFNTAQKTLEGVPQVSYVIVQLAKNLGQPAATATGLSHAVGDVLVTMDDDLSFAPDQILCLLDSLNESVDFVMGAPYRYQNSNVRRLFSQVARRLAMRAFDTPHHFVLSSFVAYKKGFISRLNFSSMRVDEIGWMFQYTSRYVNTNVIATASIRKRTKYGISKLVRTAVPLLVPILRLGGVVSRWCSGLSALLAVLLSAVYLFRALAIGGLQPGFPTLVIVMLLNLSIASILLSLQLSSTAAIRELRKPSFLVMQRRIAART